MFRGIIALSLLLPFGSAASADNSALVGVWKLKSVVVETVETKERKPLWGEHPKGFMVLTPERLIGIMTGEGRKPPQTDEDRLSSFRTMTAYSGLYRIEGNRLTTKVEVSWNEGWTGTDQTRIFRLEGDKLFLETIPAPAINNPQLGMVRGILEWERSK
jgi:hypothetical protein